MTSLSLLGGVLAVCVLGYLGFVLLFPETLS